MDRVAPILFFDSGVGGLSVLGPTRALLPDAPIVYAADSAGFPYGRRSESELAERVPALLARLAEQFDPPADRDRLQHREHDRARPCPRRARRSDRRHGARDQARGRAVEKPGDRRARAPRRRCASPMSTISPRGSRPIAPSSATARPSWSSWPRPSSRRARSILQAVARRDPADGRCRSRHGRDGPRLHPFPLARGGDCGSLSGIAQVDGAAGIARRIAHLTKGQQWPPAAPPGDCRLHRRTRRPASLHARPLRPDTISAPSSCESFALALERPAR